MQIIRKSFITQSITLLVANVFGAMLYVFGASRGGWAIPEERATGIHTTTGEPFVWFISILPVVATFSAINLAWGGKDSHPQRLAKRPLMAISAE
jgi:hypothetical protein